MGGGGEQKKRTEQTKKRFCRRSARYFTASTVVDLEFLPFVFDRFVLGAYCKPSVEQITALV